MHLYKEIPDKKVETVYMNNGKKQDQFILTVDISSVPDSQCKDNQLLILYKTK